MTPRILGFSYTPNISFITAEGGLLRPVVNIQLQDMADELARYWRWCAEGRLPYHTDYSARAARDSACQYYYDNYRNHIEWHPEAGDYSFRIQTFDSPEGDTWLEGRFTFENGSGITVTHQKAVQQ